jgi:hypothetical protein
MKRIAIRSGYFTAAAAAIVFFSAGAAFAIEPGTAIERPQLIKITPQAVVIGQGASGMTNVSKVIVTNTSTAPVHLNVIFNATWLRITPASIDLDPGKSTSLSVSGDLGSLEQVIAPVSREGQSIDTGDRPVTGVAPVTVSSGKAGAVFVVFALRMGAK